MPTHSIVASKFQADVDKARSEYLASQTPANQRKDWSDARRSAELDVRAALADSLQLADIGAALQTNASHMQVFRRLMAPPKSQAQFKILCPNWSQSSEKPGAGGNKKLKPAVAAEVATAFAVWRDREMTCWLDEKRSPTAPEIARVIHALEPGLADQRLKTAERMRLSREQEGATVVCLQSIPLVLERPSAISDSSHLPAGRYACRVRVATRGGFKTADIACGLRGNRILALECKVTNDTTNSVKRIDTVVKNAAAWQQHWGSFVVTAVILQGMIAVGDVQRLDNDGVRVFWSHDMRAFATWLRSEL